MPPTTPRFPSLFVDVPDFPKPGIVFKDITPALADPEGLREMIDLLAARWRDAGVTQVVGVESRGFIFAAGLAYALGAGMGIIRKPGKLPRPTLSVTYDLEYGSDTIHIHADALTAQDRVLVLDDVLATGGTAAAAAKLVAQTGATLVGLGFVLELGFLHGRERLPAGIPVDALQTI